MSDPASSRRVLTVGASMAVAGAMLTFAVWWLALRTHWGQLTDWIGFEGMAAVLEQGRWPDIESILRGMRVVALVGLVLAAAILIIGRRQRLVTVRVLVLVLGAIVTVVALNEAAPSVFRPGAVPVLPFTGSVDFTTTMFACAGAAVIMAVRPMNRAGVAVLIALLVGGLTAGQMVSYGQRPSTYITALLVTAIWAGLGIVAGAIARRKGLIGPAPQLPPASRGATAIGLTILGLIGLGSAIVAVVLIAQWHAGTLPYGGFYGQQAMTFLATTLAVGSAACLTTAAILATLHVADGGPEETSSQADPSWTHA